MTVNVDVHSVDDFSSAGIMMWSISSHAVTAPVLAGCTSFMYLPSEPRV